MRLMIPGCVLHAIEVWDLICTPFVCILMSLLHSFVILKVDLSLES